MMSICCPHFTLCSSVFRVSIVDFEQVKSRLGSKSHHSKKRWYNSFVVRKKHWFIVVRGKLRTCFQSLTIFTRSSIFRSVTWCWICLGYFFRFTFIIDPFSSPNYFKYQWYVNSAHKYLFDTRDSTTAGIPFKFFFWLNLGRSLHFFLILL